MCYMIEHGSGSIAENPHGKLTVGESYHLPVSDRSLSCTWHCHLEVSIQVGSVDRIPVHDKGLPIRNFSCGFCRLDHSTNIYNHADHEMVLVLNFLPGAPSPVSEGGRLLLQPFLEYEIPLWPLFFHSGQDEKRKKIKKRKKRKRKKTCF